MTLESCLNRAKALGKSGDSQESLIYLERARRKLRYPKYQGKKIVGFELVEDKPTPKPKPKKTEVKKSGKKSKG
tara:strand:- start:1129 stop:1350 length:222 start_codon:yes stop_codon:yes gene_type:complete